MSLPLTKPLAELQSADGLSAHNRKVFEYWQSLRHGDALPNRADFNPARIRFALPRVAIISARPGEAGGYRLVGTAIVLALGFDPTGHELNSLTPKQFHQSRVDRHNRILSGEALRTFRLGSTNMGRTGSYQELFLPFGDVREDGSRDILLSSDFVHEHFGERTGNPEQVFCPPAETFFFKL